MGGTHFQIIGTIMQAVTVRLSRGQQFYSEVGSLSWMSDGVQMDTNLGGGGLMGALGRVVTGESLFVVNYTAHQTALSSPSAAISPARSSRSTWPRARA